MTTRLFLIRHGVTDSNLARRYMGRSEEPLSPEGRWQARRLGLRLADVELAALYASPLARARQTAEIVGQPHALPPTSDPRFNELDLERWQGLSAAEISARDGEAWQTWCVEPARLSLPGIERFADLQQRVRRGIEGLVRRHPSCNVALVTHDGIVRIAVLEALEMSVAHYRAIAVDNTGLTVLDFAPERTYLRALNDTGHLGAEGLASVPGPADQ